MLEFFIFILIGTFLYFGGLQGVFSLLAGFVNLVINIVYWIPVIVGALALYFMYWIAYIY